MEEREGDGVRGRKWEAGRDKREREERGIKGGKRREGGREEETKRVESESMREDVVVAWWASSVVAVWSRRRRQGVHWAVEGHGKEIKGGRRGLGGSDKDFYAPHKEY